MQLPCREEEYSFNRTLDKGIARLKKAATATTETGGKQISGADAFEMWDTYGFPLDLTVVGGFLCLVHVWYTRQQWLSPTGIGHCMLAESELCGTI